MIGFKYVGFKENYLLRASISQTRLTTVPTTKFLYTHYTVITVLKAIRSESYFKNQLFRRP